VYWVRRLVVLAVLAVVVGTGYGVVGFLADSWSAAARPDLAAPAGAEVAATAGPAAGATGQPTGQPTSRRPAAKAGGSGSEQARESLPEPEGDCPDADVVVRPHVTDAHVGAPIRIVLEVSTRSTPACTWEVSPDSVFLKVLRGDEGAEVVWSSQQCPDLVPTAQVVARQERAAEVVVSWSGQMSDPGCTDQPAWVHAGTFRAVSVARGAVKPREELFDLEKAVPEVVVVPPTPTEDASPGAGEAPSDEASGSDR
jgi:hypothetical protein